MPNKELVNPILKLIYFLSNFDINLESLESFEGLESYSLLTF